MSATKGCDEWPLLTDEEISSFMEKATMWELFEEDGMKKLRRNFVAKGFQAAMDFVVAAGGVAEARGHHPDLHLTGYRNVSVVVYTHSLKGLTENDFLLCGEIDACKVAYSPKWLKTNPAAADSAL